MYKLRHSSLVHFIVNPILPAHTLWNVFNQNKKNVRDIFIKKKTKNYPAAITATGTTSLSSSLQNTTLSISIPFVLSL